MKSPKALTLETSFFGFDAEGKRNHFSSVDIRTIGERLLVGIYLANVKENRLDVGLNFQTI